MIRLIETAEPLQHDRGWRFTCLRILRLQLLLWPPPLCLYRTSVGQLKLQLIPLCVARTQSAREINEFYRSNCSETAGVTTVVS